MTFPTEVRGWRSILNGKWLLFDSDAVISILAFEQKYVFDELKTVAAGFAYINPVLLELMNTNSPAEKLRRSKLLVDYDFIDLPLTSTELKLAGQIQKSLPLKCQPSSTDLYLGGTLGKYHEGNCLLLTANIKDFPLPIYTREGYLLLQRNDNLKTLSFLGLDHEKLV